MLKGEMDERTTGAASNAWPWFLSGFLNTAFTYRAAPLVVCIGLIDEEYREGMAQQPDDSVPESGSPEDKASQLAAYDLDGDGEVGVVEGLRAELGILDAHLEDVAEEGGIKGKIAEAAHQVVDRLDND